MFSLDVKPTFNSKLQLQSPQFRHLYIIAEKTTVTVLFILFISTQKIKQLALMQIYFSSNCIEGMLDRPNYMKNTNKMQCHIMVSEVFNSNLKIIHTGNYNTYKNNIKDL